jgi:hypothetical protein
MSSKFKGITGSGGLMVLALVIAITIGVVFLISIIPLADKILKIRAEADYTILRDDRGTALAAFLASDSGKGSYAEILGSYAAQGVDENIGSDISKILSGMRPNGRVAVYDAYDNKIKEFGGIITDNYFKSDLALPGITKGSIAKGSIRVS